jgi:hypothetical protein
MSTITRKEFLHLSGAGILASTTLSGFTAAAPSKDSQEKLNLGMASYTLRKFTLDEVIAICQRLGLKHVALKDFHLPMGNSPEQLKASAAKVREAGIELYGGGVIYMKSEDEVNRSFDYARHAGFKMIVGVPNHDLLKLVDQKVKETNIMLAIHTMARAMKYIRVRNRFTKKLKTWINALACASTLAIRSALAKIR